MNANEVPYLRPVTVPNPAVGADWRHTGPGQGVQRVVALRALLTASAAVANRLVSLVLSDGTDDFAASPLTTAVTAGLAVPVSTFPGAQAGGALTTVLTAAAPTDGWMLLPGWSIRAATTALDVGDQWSAIRLWVVEYPTGPSMRRTPDVPTFDEPR